MKKRVSLWLFASVVATATFGCSSRTPVWNGTWKLNVSRSARPGPNFVLTISPSGEYHFDDGTYSYNFRCDGKEYATVPKRTISCVQPNPSVIDTISREDGVTKATSHLELSPDGETLSGTRTSVDANGSTKKTEAAYSRTSKSTGFAGGWKDAKRLEAIGPMLLNLDQRHLHISFPGNGESMDLPLDGSDASILGPSVPQGLTMAVRVHGQREFLTVKKAAGKVVNEGSLKLSWDGRTLTEEYWSPRAPGEKAILIYEKQ